MFAKHLQIESSLVIPHEQCNVITTLSRQLHISTSKIVSAPKNLGKSIWFLDGILWTKEVSRPRRYFPPVFTGDMPLVDPDLTVVFELACGLDPDVGFAVELPVDVPEESSFVPNMAR